MAIVTDFVDNTYPVQLTGTQRFTAENKISFAQRNCSAADVVQLIKVPADCFIEKVAIGVVTAEGGTLTATIGDGDAANGWDASANFNATAGTAAGISLEGTDTYGLGKFYNAADTIDATLGEAADTAVIVVKIFGAKMENPIA